MISKSLIEMTKGRWREFKREPSAMFFVVFMPLLWMVILGLAFSNSKPEVYSVGILKEKSSQVLQDQGKSLVSYLDDHEQVKIRLGGLRDVKLWLKRGEILLFVQESVPGKVSYSFDPHNPEAKRAQLFVDDLIQRLHGRNDPVISAIEPITAVGSRYIDFLIPGLLALSLLTTSLFGTGMTIVANRRENLLKRMCATPMNPYEYIISHIFGRYFIFVVEFLTIMITGILLFGFQVQGNWLSFLIVGLVGTACFTSLSILCGAKTNNTSTYNGINNLITLPMMMLSGIWFSRNHYPDWLEGILGYLPLSACVDALRKVSLEGASLSQVSPELLLLLAYGLICTVVAKVNFRWY